MSVPAVRTDAPWSAQIFDRLKWVLTRCVTAAAWLGFLWFSARVISGTDVDHVIQAALWLGRLVTAYWFLLVAWIGFNIVLYRMRGPVQPKAAAAVDFSKDYFGRKVVVAEGANLRASHLVMDLEDDVKMYSIGQGPTTEEEEETESLGALAAQLNDDKTKAASHAATASGN